ncbi:LacI family transcriptional regulator [Halomonas cupida]|uniref:LacI family transcriptional regulator n=1 Tax=Halomonas cupida TaxID=44933 RepID=A0A1M7E484_9GAMM|nr:LacI family DNA-binding transcriptional regulator [Halomonas cupida]GEN22847.1 LacI family transcriptional regulator [Halomonas cupida]SHL86513.1 transcriptional regulator, LacI family [Halomonas cupida]
MKRKGTVTINDIARHVGLTNITVSRAFKHPDKVKSATRERILAAARELGYVPNAFASQLRSSQSRLIGVVIASIDNPFYSEAIKAISRDAKARGYDILLMDTDGDSNVEAAAIQTLLSYQVAGIILSPVSDALDYLPVYIDTLRDAQLPLVMLDRTLPVEDFPQVVLDNCKAGWLLGNAMLKRNLDQALVLTGPASSYITRQRLKGIEDAYGQANASIKLDRREGLYNFEPAYDAVVRYLSESGQPSAIVGLNQLMTLGALSALHDGGISYHDATVLGVDQLPYCGIFDIRIPTTRFDASYAGHQAIHLLLARIANPTAEPQRVVIDASMDE